MIFSFFSFDFFRHNGWFVDLFVRAGNSIAITMYRNLGYGIYRTVNKYYAGSEKHPSEDAYGNKNNISGLCLTILVLDMRKSMPRDTTGEMSRETGRRIEPHELEWQ